MQTARRGAPRRPLERKVAGKVLNWYGSCSRIEWLLTEGGETKFNIVRKAGLQCSRQWACVIMEQLGIHVPRDRSVAWRIMNLCRRTPALKNRPKQALRELVCKFSNRQWLTRQVKQFGSFQKVAQAYSLPGTSLRVILTEEGIAIPHKTAVMVGLRCTFCKKRFLRRAALYQSQTKRLGDTPVFCRKGHFHAYRRQHHY